MGELSDLDEANVLLSSGAFQPGETTACRQLGSVGDPAAMVAVTVSQTADQVVETFTREQRPPLDRLWIVDVGEQLRSAASDGTTHQTRQDTEFTVRPVTSPGNLTDLGVAITSGFEALNEPEPAGSIPMCFNAIGPLFQYADSRSVYQFLQVLTDHVRTQGVTGHYHCNPEAIEAEDWALLPLFDAVVDVSGEEVTITRAA